MIIAHYTPVAPFFTGGSYQQHDTIRITNLYEYTNTDLIRTFVKDS